MKKHTLPIMAAALAVVVIGTWGSMQKVSAQDTIKVIPAGAGTTSIASNKTGSASLSKRSVASSDGTGSKITITVTHSDSSDDSKTGEIAGIPYDELVMANVEEAVNIRDEASEEGKIIGKFYKECAGTILDKSSGWTEVQTGDVTGWISNDYLLFGDEAAELADKVVEKTATCTTDCLRVRKSADPDGAVLDLLAEGDQIGVLDELGDWVEVEYSDGQTGYVSSQYVTISDELGTGRSMEEIAALEEAEKAEREAAAKKTDSSSKTSSNSKSDSKSESAASGSSEGTSSASAAGYSDAVLLAALIQAESGTQPYEGQVAVGNVVTNRLKSGRYGNSIYSVIFAKSQFGPAGSGQVAQIAAAGPSATCLAAAQDALNGVNYVGTATHFRSVSSGNQGIVIGAHVFW